ncbi:MAG: DoxX family protein [Flavobacteriaceae bacterium]|nr:DoxX family protein [Flavobacteriaceae bacterium]
MIITGLWYFVCYEDLVIYFESYGYPVYLIYPLAILKIAGSMVILININRFLVELAYAGFLFNFILAFFAHLMINEFDPFPTLSLILLIISYCTGKSIRG